MATLSGQLVLALFLLGLTILPSGVQAICCDDDNCYDLLGLTQAAIPQEVKQAYRKLSLKYHPDKNPDPEATATFLNFSNAYEILGDESRREDYDYALEHPEYFLWNTARYYQAYYGPQADPLSVLLGLLLVLSAFQYLNQWTRYRQVVDMVKQTPAYKNKLKALELERSGGSGNRKKAFKVKSSKGELEDLSKELDLQIQGAQKPVLLGLPGIQVVILPFSILKLLVWRMSWMWRYWVKRLPYNWEDAAFFCSFANAWPFTTSFEICLLAGGLAVDLIFCVLAKRLELIFTVCAGWQAGKIYGLYRALIYLLSKGLDDFKSPLQELLVVAQDPQNPHCESFGYKSLV